MVYFFCQIFYEKPPLSALVYLDSAVEHGLVKAGCTYCSAYFVRADYSGRYVSEKAFIGDK